MADKSLPSIQSRVKIVQIEKRKEEMNMKKFFAILMTLALMLSLAVPAMADDVTTYTITINNPVDGYTYVAYQIFTGDLKAVEGDATDILSNIVWGNGVNTGAAGFNMGDAATKAASLTNDNVKQFAQDISAYLQNHSTAATYDSEKTVYTISGLAPGYYLIKNTGVPGNIDDAFYTDYILEVVEDTTVSPKGDYPESNKKVMDTDDSTGIDSDWQDSADYDIGDDVPFKLTATMPSNLADYETYVLVFHDKLSAGLSFNNDVVVKVNDKKIASGYTVVTDTEQLCNDCSFEVRFADVTADTVKATAGGTITVEYTAKLTGNAVVIGGDGNDNSMHIEYSNDPNNNGEGKPTGTTPDDVVTVFTFKLVVDKVHKTGEDADGNPIYGALAGAGFTLYKWDAEANDWVAVDPEITGVTTFDWTGLDDGDYKLVETTTPAGYNTITPIEFTITAEHETNDDVPQLTGLTVTVTAGSAEITATPATGSLTTRVVNNAGSTLPETGGMGTTIFYIVGGIMVVAAVVLLVTKKRMSAEG